MKERPSSAAREKASFLLKWMTLKSLGNGAFFEFQQPFIEGEDGTWDVDRYLATRLSSCEIYQVVPFLLNLDKNVNDFEVLLQILTNLSGGKRVTLDPAFLEVYYGDSNQGNNESQDECEPRWKNGLSKRCVQLSDLTMLPWSSESSQIKQSKDILIWISAHVAITEVILRIHLSQLITQKRLIDALSTVIGCRASSNSLVTLQGADGALFWLVVVAARTASLLGIRDCSDWLQSHLLDGTPKARGDSVSSNTSSTTLTSDSLDDAADKFLRGIAMANLLALALHFYRPELAPEEDFYFNFGPGGELEPAASHHNARTVASICRAHQDELFNLLALMPTACFDMHDQEAHRRSVTSNHVTLLGFCSQGLARSPAHRRLQNATLAAELFMWVSKQAPDRQIPPIRPGGQRIHRKTSTDSSDVSHQSRVCPNELTTPTNFVPGFNHGTKTSTTDCYRPEAVPVPHNCSTPPCETIALGPGSPTGQETYRLIRQNNHNDLSGEELHIGGNHELVNTASAQVKRFTDQVPNQPTSPCTNQPTGNVCPGCSAPGVFYAQPVHTSDSGAHAPFRLAERTVSCNTASSRATNQMNDDPLQMLFHQRSSSHGNVLMDATEHQTPRSSRQPPGLRKVRALWNTPHTNRSQSVCSPPATRTGPDRPDRQETSQNQSLVKGPRKKNTSTSDDTDSFFVRDIPSNSARRPSKCNGHSKVKTSTYHSMFDLPETYPRRTVVRPRQNLSQSGEVTNTTALANGEIDVIPDSLYAPHQPDAESSATTDNDPSDEVYTSGDVIKPKEQTYPNYSATTPRRTRWQNNVEKSGVRVKRPTRRTTRSVRSAKRTESPPYVYYPTGSYPQPVRADHCVVPIIYPIESTVSPRQTYAIHCDPYCVQPTWIHPHPLPVMSPNPFMPPSQFYMGSVPSTHSAVVNPFNPHSTQTGFNLGQEATENGVKTDAIPSNGHMESVPNNIKETTVSKDKNITNTSEEQNKIVESNPSDSVCTANISRPENRKDLIKPNLTEESTRSQNSEIDKCQSAQSFFVSIGREKVSSQPAFGLRGPLRSTSLMRSRKTKRRVEETGDIQQVTSSTGPSSSTLRQESNDEPTSGGNRPDSEKPSSKDSVTEKLPKQETDSTKVPAVGPLATTSTHSPRNLIKANSLDSKVPSKYPEVTDQLQQREQRRELERQRREAIFQAYLNRKMSVSSEKETDNSRPSTASSARNRHAKDHKPNSNGSIKSTDAPMTNKPRGGNGIVRRPVSLSRSAMNAKQTEVKEPKTQARDELALLRVKSSTAAELPPAGSNMTEPKLFVELKTKSNRRVIANALSHCCLAGPVNEEAKHTALAALGCSDGKHFMILLRSQCQYGGLYQYSPSEDQAIRVSGSGPRKIENNMVAHYYKYDSGSKRFSEITSTCHLSTVVDAVMLHGRTRNRLPSGAAVT